METSILGPHLHAFAQDIRRTSFRRELFDLLSDVQRLNIARWMMTFSLSSTFVWKFIFRYCQGECEVAAFSAKRRDRRSSEALIESAAPCHDAQMVGPYRVSNPLHLTVLTAK